MHDELCDRSATELIGLLHTRQLSAREVLDAHLARIERANPAVNAIVTLVPERARAQAQDADDGLARGEIPGMLHGLPIAHKDLVSTAGIRTTLGSPIFADRVPDEDDLLVERIRAAGAILIGKTNTPEFGAGSNTFNPVFGSTRNPYDLVKTAGGSSGGAAAAVASGMLPIADGSDHGGSLRNPASFCNVVGFRPTPGRVPSWPDGNPGDDLVVEGPIARTVEDAALLLAAMSGPDPRVPGSLTEPGSTFAPPLEWDLDAPSVAWAPTCGGTMPVDARVSAVVDGARSSFERIGCQTEEAFPDLSGARESFLTLRARMYATRFGELLDSYPDQLKETVVWNIEEGRRVTGEAVTRARRLRDDVRKRVADFFGRFDLLVLPTVQVPPFDVEEEYPATVAGVPMRTYIDWMESCWYISLTGSPAISVPCGFTAEGLPVGAQIVGRWGEDLAVLRAANAFEQATGVGSRRPNL
jgi:amidase